MLDPLENRDIRSLVSLKKARTLRLNVQSKWRSASSSIGRWIPVAAQWTNPERCGLRLVISVQVVPNLFRWSDPHDTAQSVSVPPSDPLQVFGGLFVAEIIRDHRSTRPREAGGNGLADAACAPGDQNRFVAQRKQTIPACAHGGFIPKLADPDSSCVNSSGTSIAKKYGGSKRYGHSAQAP